MPTPTVLARLQEMVPTISVGMLTADLMSLGGELRLLEQSGVGLLHLDVMDGCFVPPMTFGPPLIKWMNTPLLKDVHLMIEKPLEKMADYVAAGADMVTVHVESSRHIHRVLQVLGKMTNANDPQRGIARGIALDPGTPVEMIEPLLDEVETVFLLAINPGWGGQKFLASTQRRIGQVKELADRLNRPILIGVDGGITRDNIGSVARIGADIIVTGSAVFDGKDPAGNARFMLNTIKG